MSKWSSLYENEITQTSIDKYIYHKLKNKKNVIKLINKYAYNNQIMECGAGTGILALHLSTMNYYVTALDSDKDMIDLSKRYFLNKFKDAKINYICSDIRDITVAEKFDVIYSIGILEHYSDSDIIDLINKQISMCNTVIFGIPTRYFDEDKKMYGNERYLSIRYWRNLIKKSNCKIIEEASYHYSNILQRVLNYKKYFKPNPVHIFVLRDIKSCK